MISDYDLLKVQCLAFFGRYWEKSHFCILSEQTTPYSMGWWLNSQVLEPDRPGFKFWPVTSWFYFLRQGFIFSKPRWSYFKNRGNHRSRKKRTNHMKQEHTKRKYKSPWNTWKDLEPYKRKLKLHGDIMFITHQTGWTQSFDNSSLVKAKGKTGTLMYH